MDKPASQNAAGCKPITTFVQTDTQTFREVVQRLTGPTESDAAEGTSNNIAGTKRPMSKLHERRQCGRPKLEIVKPDIPINPGTLDLQSFSTAVPGNSSFHPSPANTPSTIFSKFSMDEKKEKCAIPELNTEEEDRAIKERRFYLHPSPRSKPGYAEPELLSLFPLASPRTEI